MFHGKYWLILNQKTSTHVKKLESALQCFKRKTTTLEEHRAIKLDSCQDSRWHSDSSGGAVIQSSLAKVLERFRVMANHSPEMVKPDLIVFVKVCSTLQAPDQRRNVILSVCKDGKMLVDLRKKLVFPRKVITFTLVRYCPVVYSREKGLYH